MDKTGQSFHPAKTYDESGALKDLLKKVDDPKIQSLGDVLNFRINYLDERQKKVSDSIAEVKLQISKMTAEINELTLEKDQSVKSRSEELNRSISSLEGALAAPYLKRNFLTELYYKINRWSLRERLKYFKNNSPVILRNIAEDFNKRITNIQSRVKHIENNVEDTAKKNISSELSTLDDIYKKTEEEKYLLYGAIGETKVINELKKLPGKYHVINNFRKEFDRPIYNRAEDDRIYSIQVDHLVVGPTGVFVIETKYWSNKSVSNDMLFSPVKQVKRAGFALFVLLNDAIKSGHIEKLVNHWGDRKISPRQIVACVNSSPHAEFQYVKVLGIENLNSYITFGKQELTTDETQDIVDYLLQVRRSS